MTSTLPSESPAAPLVSVCIPAWRGAATLPQTIASVLAQSCTDFELVIVDDASPDATAEVVAGFSDTRLRFIRQPVNGGAQANWNRCLALARGRYFKLLPQDDLLHPECLARQVAVLEADRSEALALVCCARDVIDPRGRVLLRARGMRGQASGVLPAPAVLRRCSIAGTNVIGEPGAVLMRRSLAQRLGGFDGRFPYVIDLDFWTRALAHGALHYEAQALASFRVWPGSWSVAIGTAQADQFRRYVAHAQAQGLWPELNAAERLCGRFMPVLNQWLRQAFYAAFVGRAEASGR